MIVLIEDTDTGISTVSKASTVTFYRVYENGSILHQDDFNDDDIEQAMYCYDLIMVPDGLNSREIGMCNFPECLEEYLLSELFTSLEEMLC